MRHAREALAACWCGMALMAFDAQACRCPGGVSPGMAFGHADAVVVATVRSVQGDPAVGPTMAHLSVERSWKREVGAEIDVSTHTSCAYPFFEGERAVFFLRTTTGGGWETQSCMGNVRSDGAKRTFDWLRARGGPAMSAR